MATKKNISHKEIKVLLAIAEKVLNKQPIYPSEADMMFDFTYTEKKNKLQAFLLKIALPVSIMFGMSQAAFPAFYQTLAAKLPDWTNMHNDLLAAVDYVWSIIGKPVKLNNIIYHVPNIFLYSFGVFGVKKLFDYVRRKTWLDKVTGAKETLEKEMEKGSMQYRLQNRHTLLFIGRGDFIGEQFCIRNKPDDVITLATHKPNYTRHWTKYDITNSYAMLEKAMLLAAAKNAGEYILFPVKDTELFLPGEREYDVSPEKVEVLIQTIRDVESVNGWEPKRIIIVGDRKQITMVRTETKNAVLEDSLENISLTSIDKDIRKVTIVDASDLVVKEILRRHPGKRIYLRTSIDGSNAYKKRFYDRLEELGYNDNSSYNQSVIIGYDMYEEQVQRATFRNTSQDYLPIVLSKETYDALHRKGFTKNQFIYVPDLVLTELQALAASN